MTPPRILAFAGSLRQDSFNWKLVRAAAAAARSAGAEVRLLEPSDLDLPLFSEDREKSGGMPPAAQRFKRALVEAQGFLIASPEYNASMSAALKNAIDWASRTEAPGEPPLLAFQGRPAALFSASPGALGGLRGLVHLTLVLQNLRVFVLPEQRALGRAHEAFEEDGSLRDKAVAAHVGRLAGQLVDSVRRLSS